MKNLCKLCNKKLISYNTKYHRDCYNTVRKTPINLCNNCGKETKNPKYCSSKCSATKTNKETKRRKLTKRCRLCDTLILSSRTFCKEHKHTQNISRNEETLEQMLYKDDTKNNIYQKIRSRARLTVNRFNISSCQNCGYNKFIEVCHIIPIYKFSKDTKISVINSPSNLLYLCPNCHKEFDNGILSIQNIKH